MKKKIIVVLSIFTLLFMVSCGSKPEEEAVEPEAPVEVETPAEESSIEETPVAENSVEESPVESIEELPIEEIAQEDIDALLAEIKVARDRAVEAGAETKYPEDLKKADDYFESVKDDKATLKNEHGKIVESYDAITDKIALDNLIAELVSKIESARAEAVKAGVEEYLPEELKQLDDYTAKLRESNETFLADGPKVPEYYNTLVEMTNDILAKKIIADIDAARARAIEAGAEKSVPDALYELDSYVKSLKENRELLLTAGPNVPSSYDGLIVAMEEQVAEQKLLVAIDNSRNEAINAGAEEEAPEELKRLDEYFASLRQNKEAWKLEGQNIPGYYASLKKFVNDKKIAANIFVNIDSARELAIKAGAETKTPEVLKRIDEYATLISGNSGSVKANGHKVSNSYKSLVPYIGALEAKEAVDEENLVPYSQTVYDRACAKMASVEEAYKDIDDVPQSIIRDATDARRDFRSVINIAYKDQANTERDLAYEAKKNADKVRAGVTQKDRYRVAVENFKKGDSLYSMQDAKNAAKYYQAARDEFAALHDDVSEDMLVALAAIEAAKKNVAESSQYAAEADEMAPIKSGEVEGIEDEDTVLLEADEYEDPNASVIVVDDVVEVSEDAVVEEEPEEELVTDEQYVDVPAEPETENEVETETESEETELDETETVPAEEESDTTETEDEKESAENVETETLPENTESSETTETVPEESAEIEESSEDEVEAPVITDEVVTDPAAATEEKEEVSKDDFFNSGVFAK